MHFASARTQALTGKLRKGQYQVSNVLRRKIKKIDIEVKRLPNAEGLPVQVHGAKNKGPRPIRQTAWASLHGTGLKQTGIRTTVSHIAGRSGTAFRQAGNSAEDQAQCPAQDIGGFAWREMDGIARDKSETKRLKAKKQLISL